MEGVVKNWETKVALDLHASDAQVNTGHVMVW
jgi:hypothetical protein